MLGDSVEFVALWYGAQKIGAVTAEAYTFLQAKDYAYFLDYTPRRRGRRRRDDARQGARGGDVEPLAPARAGRRRHAERAERRRGLVRAAGGEGAGRPRGRADDEGRRRDLEVHDRQHGAAEGRRPPAAQRRCSASTGTREACWASREDDVVLPVPKLFFGYARDLAALYPFGVGGAGIVFPERTTPERIFELVAEHRPTILVQVPTMMAAMVVPSRRGRAGPVLPAPVHFGRRGAPARAARALAGTFGVEVLDGIGSSEAYHIYISNRPGGCGPGAPASWCPATRRSLAEQRRALDRGRHGRAPVLGRAREDEADVQRRHGRTGDLFERDEDGFFWYRGRADDLIKVGGSGSRRPRSRTACSGTPMWSSARSSATSRKG